MIHYRKSGLRTFVKVEGTIVTSVLNREKSATITKYEDAPMTAEGIVNDSQGYPPCTEEEFNTAYKEAMERITSGKI